MIIKSIILNNFRQYKGENYIEFSIDPVKNVTVIIGENTCGKTTLVQSFIWCLYGVSEFKDKKMLNEEEYHELVSNYEVRNKKVFVSIDLLHDDKNYLITREEKYEKDLDKKIEIKKDFKIFEKDKYGNLTPLNGKEKEDLIINILPQNLSDYFFFWGERIEKLGEKKELASAVKQFLGLDTFDSSIRHLKLAKNKLYKEIPNESGNGDIESFKNNIRKLEEEKETRLKDIENENKNHDFLECQVSELFNKLTTSENKELASNANEYKEINTKLNIAYQRLSNAKNRFSDTFNDSSNFVYYLCELVEKKAIKLLKDNKEPTIGWTYIDENAINEILKRKECICGSKFCTNDSTYKYLIEQKAIVAPNVIGPTINSFIETSERRRNLNKDYINKLHEDYKDINICNDEVIKYETRKEELEKLLSGKDDYDNLLQRHNNYKEKVVKSAERLVLLKNRINEIDSEMATLHSNIQISMRKNNKYKKQEQELIVVEKVLNKFEDEYRDKENIIRNKLQEDVNRNFDEIYSGSRKIEIDEKYNAIALNKVGDEWRKQETSPGLETVKNFAFITGLVQCAKEKISGVNGDEEANKNPYPLVLDAPFSQADEKHIPAISKLISNNAEQIILVVMRKDWNYASNVLKNKVAKSYELIKKTETHTTVERGR